MRENEERIKPVSALAPKMTFAALEEVMTVAAILFGRKCQLALANQGRMNSQSRNTLKVAFGRRECHGAIPQHAVDLSDLRANSI